MVPSGRRPALIGTRWRRPAGRIDLARCSSRGAGPRWALCRLSQVWGHPGEMAFHVVVAKPCHPARGGGRGVGGYAGSGEGGLEAGDPQPASHTLERVRRGGFRVREGCGILCSLTVLLFSVCHIGLGPPPLTYTWGPCCSSKLRDPAQIRGSLSCIWTADVAQLVRTLPSTRKS